MHSLQAATSKARQFRAARSGALGGRCPIPRDSHSWATCHTPVPRGGAWEGVRRGQGRPDLHQGSGVCPPALAGAQEPAATPAVPSPPPRAQAQLLPARGTDPPASSDKVRGPEWAPAGAGGAPPPGVLGGARGAAGPFVLDAGAGVAGTGPARRAGPQVSSSAPRGVRGTSADSPPLPAAQVARVLCARAPQQRQQHRQQPQQPRQPRRARARARDGRPQPLLPRARRAPHARLWFGR